MKALSTVRGKWMRVNNIDFFVVASMLSIRTHEADSFVERTTWVPAEIEGNHLYLAESYIVANRDSFL